MSNFSFSNSVFKIFALQTCKNKGLFGKGLKTSTIPYYLSATIILVFINFKAFADNNVLISIAQTIIMVTDMIENNVEKGENTVFLQQ